MEIFIEGKTNYLIFGTQPNKAKFCVYLSKSFEYTPSTTSKYSSSTFGAKNSVVVETLASLKKISCEWLFEPTDGMHYRLIIKVNNHSVVWYQCRPDMFTLYEGDELLGDLESPRAICDDIFEWLGAKEGYIAELLSTNE